VKGFTKSDNEMLHRMCETYDVDPLRGRKFAGGISRLIKRQEKELITLRTQLYEIYERVRRDAREGRGITLGLLDMVVATQPRKKIKT
jgi:hypothetical protein